MMGIMQMGSTQVPSGANERTVEHTASGAIERLASWVLWVMEGV
jgi:hypothetical protein